MGRTAARQQRTPFPTTQNAKPKQPAITEADHKARAHDNRLLFPPFRTSN